MIYIPEFMFKPLWRLANKCNYILVVLILCKTVGILLGAEPT